MQHSSGDEVHGFIQAASSSHPLVFVILERTLQITAKKKEKQLMYGKVHRQNLA